MKRTWIYLVLIFTLLLSGCLPAKKTVTNKQMYEEVIAGVMNYSAPEAAPAYAADRGVAATSYSGESIPEARRLIIQNADLSIVVVDPALAMDAIINMTTEMGGFVVNTNLYKTKTYEGIEVPVANLIVRVPAEKLKEALESIKKLTPKPSEDVLSENISGQDVTKDYTDLSSRLGNLQNAASQLREILASAYKTEDVLSVYRELTKVTEEIEVIKGQMQYYEEAAAMSAITVNIQAKEAVKPLTVAGWKPVGTALEAVQALLNFWRGFVDFLIRFALYVLPMLITIGLPILGIFLLVRGLIQRRRKRKQAVTPVNPPEEK